MLEIRAKFDKVERSRKPSKSCWTSVRLLNESFFDSTFISVFRLPTWRHLWIQSTLNRYDGGKLLFAWSVCVLRDILRNSHPTSLMMKINVENSRSWLQRANIRKKLKLNFQIPANFMFWPRVTNSTISFFLSSTFITFENRNELSPLDHPFYPSSTLSFLSLVCHITHNEKKIVSISTTDWKDWRLCRC